MPSSSAAQKRAPLSQMQPIDTADSCSSDEDVSMQPRERKRKKLRKKIVRGLASSTGKADVAMNWEEHGFVENIVIGEGKMLEGWPAHIMFGDLCRIPGGLGPVEELLRLWESGTLRWRDATPEDVHNARLDHRSVLPSTPVPRRKEAPAHKDARWVVGTLVMHVSAPGIVVCCPTAPPGTKKRRRADESGGGRAAKRRHVDESPPSPPPLPRLGQRSDNNTATVRRFRNPKTGVKTPQYLWEDDAAPGGCVEMDGDLGRVLEDGRAEMF